MMNLNPLFFDKSLLIGNKNFFNSPDGSKQTYLFSDIIKICEEEIDSLPNTNALQKEILLDVNELKNLSITKSNEETVKGIQQSLEFLENCALISSSDTFNIDSSHISSKIFILNKENLREFFKKINETLQKKTAISSDELSDTKIIYLEEKKKVNKNKSEFNFVSFNSDAILKTIDNKDLFSVTLKAEGEKLTLKISKIEDDVTFNNNENVKLNTEENKLTDTNVKEQPDIFLVNKSLSNICNPVYNFSENLNNKEFDDNYDNYDNNEKSYYKLEIVHISINDNDLIFFPIDKTNKNYQIQDKINYPIDNGYLPKLSEQVEENKPKLNFIDKNIIQVKNENISEINNENKIAGIIEPVNVENLKRPNLDSETEDFGAKIKISENRDVNASFNLEQKTTRVENNDDIRTEFLEKNSKIDFNLLTGGKFTKSKIIKNVSEKNIIEFSPEIVQKKNISPEEQEIKNQIKNKLVELEGKAIKVEVKQKTNETNVSSNNILSSPSVQENKVKDINQEISWQHYGSEKSNDEIVSNVSQINLKSFFNQEKKNEVTHENTSHNYPSINTDSFKESEKVIFDDRPKEINTLKNTSVVNTKYEFEEAKVENVNPNQNLSNKEDYGKVKEGNKKEVLTKESEKDFSSNFHNQKDNLKEPQVNLYNRNEQKIELVENKLNNMPSKLQNEFVHLRESIQVINKNQLLDEISNYINSGNKQSITFQLNPENLGKLTLSVDFIENQLHAKIEVENEQIKQFIQNNIDQLKNSLQSSGIQLNDVNVSLGNYDQKSLRNTNQKKKSYSKSAYNKEIKIENTKPSSTKKMMGYNTYDFLI